MNYDELIRCLRDCWDDSTGPTCDCGHCLFRDKIVDDVDYTDYTKCETAMVLAAADAIEELSKYVNAIIRLKSEGWYLQQTKHHDGYAAIATMPLPQPPKEEA